jgi:hypothetical protein
MQVSRFGCACFPAFGRVVGVCDAGLLARLKPCPFDSRTPCVVTLGLAGLVAPPGPIKCARCGLASVILSELYSLESQMKRTIAACGLVFACVVSASAQKLDVKIVDRQDKEDSYDYVGVYNNVATGKTFRVHGATFTLLLPDGRLAVVNCESKFAEHMAGAAGNRRSCRMPIVDQIQADFHGDKAKLIWPVSLDGKKMESETYKILGILDAPKSP